VSFFIAAVCSEEVLGSFSLEFVQEFEDKKIFHDTNSYADMYDENAIARIVPEVNCGDW